MAANPDNHRAMMDKAGDHQVLSVAVQGDRMFYSDNCRPPKKHVQLAKRINPQSRSVTDKCHSFTHSPAYPGKWI